MSNTTITPQSAPNRRNVELVMLGAAVLVPCIAYVCVGLAKDVPMMSGLVKYGLGLGVLAGIAHLMVRRFAPYADPLLLPLATFLNGIGLLLIWRLDLEPVYSRIQKKDIIVQAAPTQLIWSAMGITLFVVVVFALKDHRILQRYTYIAMALSLVLLISPMPFPAKNGARIWISAGPFSIQPGEFTKIVLTVFFAGYLMIKRDALALASRKVMGLYFPRGRDMGPILVAWALSILVLVFERDLGTSLLFFGVFVILLYVATERTSWLLFGLVMASAGAVLAGSALKHVQGRVDAWLDPLGAAKDGGSDQLAQALFGYGTGGILGTGLGQGHPDQIGFAAKSDFILTSIGEEMGLAGMMAMFLVYALLVERGLRTALAARDPFGKLLAAGLSIVMALQTFIVAGGVTGLIPLTGMTMPFLAQGGSSVITNWALVAILIRISDTARRPAPAPTAVGAETVAAYAAQSANSGGGRRRRRQAAEDAPPPSGVDPALLQANAQATAQATAQGNVPGNRTGGPDVPPVEAPVPPPATPAEAPAGFGDLLSGGPMSAGPPQPPGHTGGQRYAGDQPYGPPGPNPPGQRQ